MSNAMKNYQILLFLLLVSVSCKDQSTTDGSEDANAKEIENTIVGANTDSEGCLTSAGYVWSKLKNDCVRLFDSAIRLYPKTNPATQDALLVSYLILSDDGKEVELFMPNQEQSMVLTQTKEGSPWIAADYELTAFEGYTLRKNGVIIYFGDGEIGPKITGNDKNDD